MQISLLSPWNSYQFLGMKTTDDEPTKHKMDDVLKTNIKAVRKRYFCRDIKEFIATYIVNGKIYENHFINIQALQEWKTTQANQPVLADGRFPCRFPGCSSSYKYDGVNRRRHEMSHDPPPTIPEIPDMISTALDTTDPTLMTFSTIIADL